MKKWASLILFFIFASKAFSQNSAFSSLARVTGTTNMQSTDSADHEASFDIEGWLRYKYQDGPMVKLYMTVTKEMVNNRETNIGDGYAGIANQYSPAEDLSLSIEARVGIPLSKSSRETQELRTYLQGRTILDYRLTSFMIEGFSVNYLVDIRKNLHSFETDINGSQNISHRLVNSFGTDYTYEKIRLSLSFIHSMKWSYLDTRYNDGFATYIEGSYAFTPQTSGTLGLSNSGEIYQDDGYSNNISPFNENSSTLYAQLMTRF